MWLPGTEVGREHERRLAERSQQGDEQALHDLVVAHRDLVGYMAEHYARFGGSREDLKSEGDLALVDAARRFDPQRGTRFGTYARWWVQAYMLHHLFANRRPVDLPKTRVMRKLRLRLGETERKLEQSKGSSVTRQEMAEALDVSVKDVASAQGQLRGKDVSIDEDDSAVPPTPVASSSGSPEQQTAESEYAQRLRSTTSKALSELDPRERKVVQERFLAEEQPTLRELAASLGVSRERVRQLELRALRKVQRTFEHSEPELPMSA